MPWVEGCSIYRWGLRGLKGKRLEGKGAKAPINWPARKFLSHFLHRNYKLYIESWKSLTFSTNCCVGFTREFLIYLFIFACSCLGRSESGRKIISKHYFFLSLRLDFDTHDSSKKKKKKQAVQESPFWSKRSFIFKTKNWLDYVLYTLRTFG